MRTWIFSILIISCAGCQPSTPPLALESDSSDSKEQLPETDATKEQIPVEDEVPAELSMLYENFNMRSVPSSFGPRLKYHCESYLFEYFPRSGLHVDSPTRMTLVNDSDTWVIEILSEDHIRIDNTISGPGSYLSTNEYGVRLVESAGDIRSDAAWIEQQPGCKPLRDGEPTTMGLVDLRPAPAPDDWSCGNFYRDASASAEVIQWRSLEKLPQEQDPSRHAWGPQDMLRINLQDFAARQDKCPNNEQLRRVVETPLLDRPSGAQVGSLVYVATVYSGLLDVFGYARMLEGQSYKATFDTVAGEQAVLVISSREGDWVDVSPQSRPGAWILLDAFDRDVFSVNHWTFQQRIAGASELKLKSGMDVIVRDKHYPDAEPVYTLTDSGTAILPLDIQQEWMQVRFVPPPNYPTIECGDNEDNYEWVTGWIQWRDGDEWFVTEEHHQGC